jgi:hypothetical protein
MNKDAPYGAVWALQVSDRKRVLRIGESLMKPEDIKDAWVMIHPPPVADRISRQSAKFTFHPKGQELIWESKEKNNLQCGDKIRKFTLKGKWDPVLLLEKGAPANQADEFRRLLGIMNIHRASLFPDHDGVAAFVEKELPEINKSRAQ